MNVAAGNRVHSGIGDPTVLLGIVFNIISVVGVVMINKYLSSYDKFEFMISLTGIHFGFTTIGTRVLERQGFFQYKPADIRKVLPVAIGSLGSVAFMNLNLMLNSVGFYQLSKLSCIPVILILERIWYKKNPSSAVKLSLIPILAGVGIATVTDVQINRDGSIIACAAVLCTTCAQIFTSQYQKELSCDALQLLYHTSPIITFGVIFLLPVFDNLERLMAYQFTSAVIFRIFLSCVMALAVNITNYVVLGKTDPLTYQVVGHFKTVTILVLGFTIFKAPIILKNLLGICLAMVGVIMYSEAKRKSKTEDKRMPERSLSHKKRSDNSIIEMVEEGQGRQAKSLQ